MTGAATGTIRIILRLEGLCIFLAACLGYTRFGASWWLFVLLFFAPDLSFLGYIAGPRIGAILYNSVHAYVGALLLLSLGIWLNALTLIALGLIWGAHVGVDRALGYGLKYAAGFEWTHLGRIGRKAASSNTTSDSRS